MCEEREKSCEEEEQKSDDGSVAQWQMTKNRSDFAADPLSGSPPLCVCEMVLSALHFSW